MKFALTPDSIFQTQQARQNATLRARLETVGQEAITGRRADIIEATNGRVGEAFLISKAESGIARQQGMADLAAARLSGAATSVTTIREVVMDFTSTARVTLSDGDSSDLALMAETAQDNLGHVVTALSRRIGPRHVFSGTETLGGPLASAPDIQTAIDTVVAAAPDTTSAITAVGNYFNLAGGGFETTIYNGSAADGPRLHVTDTKSFDPLPKADDPVFRDILQGLSLIAASEKTATDADKVQMIEAGLALLEKATDPLLAQEARLGASQQGVERITEDLSNELRLVSQTQDQLLGRDVFDAAAELQALEGQLEASYTITGRLGSLSLVNFLR